MTDFQLRVEIADVLNRAGVDANLHVPDFVLAEYVCECLKAFKLAQEKSLIWHGVIHSAD